MKLAHISVLRDIEVEEFQLYILAVDIDGDILAIGLTDSLIVECVPLLSTGSAGSDGPSAVAAGGCLMEDNLRHIGQSTRNSIRLSGFHLVGVLGADHGTGDIGELRVVDILNADTTEGEGYLLVAVLSAEGLHRRIFVIVLTAESAPLGIGERGVVEVLLLDGRHLVDTYTVEIARTGAHNLDIALTDIGGLGLHGDGIVGSGGTADGVVVVAGVGNDGDKVARALHRDLEDGIGVELGIAATRFQLAIGGIDFHDDALDIGIHSTGAALNTDSAGSHVLEVPRRNDILSLGDNSRKEHEAQCA